MRPSTEPLRFRGFSSRRKGKFHDGVSIIDDLKKTELIEEGSFDLVVEGCIGVFHTASLCYFDVKDPQAKMVEPVVKGTLNILGSYAKVPSIKGVLITFSIAAVILIGKPLADDVVVDETWFSDPIVCEKLKVFDFLLSSLIVPLKK
ncbi:hypothetical protein Godav_020799 [Gossypium davidsonii]|uniref:3-beta hydroxysteroid dehydrogenase/isomerase domain-containing protein n=1 Tax=Gossypium davidsonii TaxID=34287 RepID=A0A7J8R5I2_GOSDV|nr:hypothetical protein [Gossypium davidsonii]